MRYMRLKLGLILHKGLGYRRILHIYNGSQEPHLINRRLEHQIEKRTENLMQTQVV